MDFSGFDELDWSFLDATVTVGLEAPDVDEDCAADVAALVEMRVSGSRYTEGNADLLREAFEIGWSVATENGTNDLAERHRHVFEAIVGSAPAPAP